jgi:glycosyltransferase involved in cell wall biosynthesis
MRPLRPDSELRIAVVGASSAPICGVRDYARVTGEAFAGLGVGVTMLWWERDDSWGVRKTLVEARRWLNEVDEAVERDRPDWILWQYSVFTWGLRGIPFLAPIAARRLRRTGRPLVPVLHELAFPFARGGLRGVAWAIAQRVALILVGRRSGAAIVTTEERARWLRSRRWIPRRPVTFLPVCSNLPLASLRYRTTQTPSVGIFGYAAEGSLIDEVVGAFVRVSDAGTRVRLVLIGAPGDTGAIADGWRRSASRQGFTLLEFTGVLAAPELATTVAATDVVLLADDGGPSARKGTLAAALALGKPIVAVDGPERWDSLVEEQAVQLASPTAEAIAAVLQPLLRDATARERQGARAAAFYRRWMTPERLARETLALLTAIGGGSTFPSDTVGRLGQRGAAVI